MKYFSSQKGSHGIVPPWPLPPPFNHQLKYAKGLTHSSGANLGHRMYDRRREKGLVQIPAPSAPPPTCKLFNPILLLYTLKWKFWRNNFCIYVCNCNKNLYWYFFCLCLILVLYNVPDMNWTHCFMASPRPLCLTIYFNIWTTILFGLHAKSLCVGWKLYKSRPRGHHAFGCLCT